MPEQPKDKAVFGSFQTSPEKEILGFIEVGYSPVEPASTAVCNGRGRRNEPVTNVVGSIRAEGKSLPGVIQDIPKATAIARQGDQVLTVREIAQNVSTALAPRVLEVEQLSAVLAFEQFHGALITDGSEKRASRGHRSQIDCGPMTGWTMCRQHRACR